jgi:hypothetical protein
MILCRFPHKSLGGGSVIWLMMAILFWTSIQASEKVVKPKRLCKFFMLDAVNSCCKSSFLSQCKLFSVPTCENLDSGTNHLFFLHTVISYMFWNSIHLLSINVYLNRVSWWKLSKFSHIDEIQCYWLPYSLIPNELSWSFFLMNYPFFQLCFRYIFLWSF